MHDVIWPTLNKQANYLIQKPFLDETGIWVGNLQRVNYSIYDILYETVHINLTIKLYFIPTFACIKAFKLTNELMSKSGKP